MTTNKWKKYNKEENKEIEIEVTKTSEKEQRNTMEKLTNFMKKRAGMDFVFLLLLILILIIIGLIFTYF